jgi:RNA polymerase primary sigma factor
MKKVNQEKNEILEFYLKEIAKQKPLTDKEEENLYKDIKKGNLNAFNRLIEVNLKFVVSVAKQYQNQGLAMLDLINEGNIGLIKAANKYDETKGYKFISYAVYWIRQAIIQALLEQAKVVRLPLNQVGSLNKINKTYAALEQKLERAPSRKEIAEELEITEQKVEESLVLSSLKQTSIDSPLSNSEDEEDSTLVDIIENPNSNNTDKKLIENSLKSEIERCLSVLTNKEKAIIKLFFGIDEEYNYTLEEIGEKFDLTRERVRQIKEKAIRRLRHNSRNKLLIPFL